MADRELGVRVTGDIDDITAKLSELTSKMGEITDKTVDLNVNTDTSGIAELDAGLNNITDAANEVSTSIDGITPEAINEAASSAGAMGDSFGAAKEQVDQTSSSMKGMGDDAANAITSVAGLSGAFTGVGNQINSAVNAVTKFTESIGASVSAVELLGIALAAVVAVAVVAFLADATQAAGEFNDSWLRLGEAVGEGGKAIGDVQGEWSNAIQTMKDETGRSAGVIRDHIIQMGLAGVDSKDLIIDAFSGISGAAFVTGQSIDSIEQAYRRAVSTGMIGARQLMQLGITTDDVYKATGMTLDQVRDKFKNMNEEGRAAILNQIINMKYGETANEAYKNSWQHVNDALAAAWKGFEILIGQMVIPIVIPAIEYLTFVISSLSNWVKMVTDFFGSLNAVIGNSSVVFGGIIGLLSAGNPLFMALGVVAGFIADNWGRLTTSWNNFWAMIKSGDWSGALTLLVSELKWAFVDAPLAYIGSLPSKIGELASQFLDIGKNIINWIVSGLNSLSGWLDKEIAKEFNGAGQGAATATVDGFGKWLDDNGWKIVEITGDVITQIMPKIIEIVVKLVIIVGKAVLKALGDWAKDLPKNMYKWGQDAFNSFVNGIIDSIPGLRNALDQVKKLFPQSPPKTGPLADITEKGMYDWMTGIASAGTRAFEGFNLSSMVGIPATSSIRNNSTSNAVNISVPVTVDGGSIGSKSEAQQLGETVGQSAARVIEKEALNMGISVVNYKR